jgi:hypothetical protein
MVKYKRFFSLFVAVFYDIATWIFGKAKEVLLFLFGLAILGIVIYIGGAMYSIPGEIIVLFCWEIPFVIDLFLLTFITGLSLTGVFFSACPIMNILFLPIFLCRSFKKMWKLVI